MRTQESVARLRAAFERFSAFIDRRLPELITLDCAGLAVGLVVALVGWHLRLPDMQFAGVAFSVLSCVDLCWYLSREITLTRSKYRALSKYTRDLREYAVGNIEPMYRRVLELSDISPLNPPSVDIPIEGNRPDDRPLGTRERNTLLALAGILCRHADIDFTRSSKAASTIQNLAEQYGVQIGETTIEGILKKIPDALEARSK